MKSLKVFMRDQIRTRVEKRVEALEKGYRQNVGIIGCEGMGKTYLLSCLFNTLKGQAHLIPIYVNAAFLDMDHLIEKWVGAMLSGVFISQSVAPPQGYTSLISAADLIVPKTTEKIKHLKKMLRREQNAATVRELFSLTGYLEQETGKKIILMIDEFQELENLPAPDPFSLLGKEIMIEKNTLYLVASSTPSRAKDIFREKLSLLFSNFEVIELANLGFDETSDFLDKRLGDNKLSNLQKKFFIRMTDGIPKYLELLADQLQAVSNRPVMNDSDILLRSSDSFTNHDIVEAFEKELFDDRGRLALIFENRLERCRRLARDGNVFIQALLALSHGRKQVVQIAAFMEKKLQETKKILQKLLEQDCISRRGEFFLIEDPLFRFWLKEVFEKRTQQYLPSEGSSREEFWQFLRQEFQKEEHEERVDFSARLEALLKGFRNNVIEIEQKKVRCPQFHEITFRPANGRVYPLVAKTGSVRWFCQAIREMIKEEDVVSFVDELKRYRKKIHQRVMIALDGIDQNAKLIAQEAKIQLWDLRNLNQMLELYDLPKIILLSRHEKAIHEPALGTVA